MFFCRHKYGKVDKGYQYCEKCGIAIAAPILKCQHEWQDEHSLETQSRINSGLTGYKFVKKCSLCGERKLENIDLYS